ncbi:MAG: hypothetical protein HY815_08235 [Candidatus Riflebacteria bacterium]|nr:hypothetical protein [Candidatus Riflebacteria bacterium]
MVPHLSAGERRRGAGLVIGAVVMTLALLGFSAIARTLFTSNQASDCQAALAGDLCETLATSAIAEMEAQVRGALSRNHSEIARRLALPVVGDQKGEQDLTDQIALRDTLSLLAGDAYRGYSVDELSCRVAVQRSMDRLTYERVGVLKLRARARGPSYVRHVTRTVEEARAFKVALAGPPRPFDRYGFFLGDVNTVTNLDAVGPARDKLLDLLKQVRVRVEGAVSRSGGEVRERLLDVLDSLPTPETAAARTPQLQPAKPITMLYGLVLTGAKLDLTRLDLATRLQEAIAQAEGQVAALPGEGSLDLVKKSRDAGKIVADGLWSIWAYKEAFALLPPDAPAGHKELLAFLGKLDEVYLARRASYRLVEGTGSLDARLKDLLKDGALDGVIHVASLKERVELSGEFRGRLVIVVGAGGATLSNIKVANPGERLTVASLGGGVTVRGQCQAHLIVGPGNPVVVEKGAVLVGGLTIVDLAQGSRLEGTVVRDPRFLTGRPGADGSEPRASLDCAVGLSPLVLYRRVSRG